MQPSERACPTCFLPRLRPSRQLHASGDTLTTPPDGGTWARGRLAPPPALPPSRVLPITSRDLRPFFPESSKAQATRRVRRVVLINVERDTARSSQGDERLGRAGREAHPQRRQVEKGLPHSPRRANEPRAI